MSDCLVNISQSVLIKFKCEALLDLAKCKCHRHNDGKSFQCRSVKKYRYLIRRFVV